MFKYCVLLDGLRELTESCEEYCKHVFNFYGKFLRRYSKRTVLKFSVEYLGRYHFTTKSRHIKVFKEKLLLTVYKDKKRDNGIARVYLKVLHITDVNISETMVCNWKY